MLHHAITLRVKDNTKCRTHRNWKPRKRAPPLARRRKGEEAKGQPSHIGLAGLRENTLQHVRRNTRDRQLRCNEVFSNCVSSIFNAEDT